MNVAQGLATTVLQQTIGKTCTTKLSTTCLTFMQKPNRATPVALEQFHTHEYIDLLDIHAETTQSHSCSTNAVPHS